eukprot:m.41299 g.41299  ORF g.41299 m.41299 type:complete len:186 (+) comp18756_c0_seq1:242-799(+)
MFLNKIIRAGCTRVVACGTVVPKNVTRMQQRLLADVPRKSVLPTTLEELKKEYPFSDEFIIEFAELDAMQHLNNTNFFKLFERIRIRHFMEKVDPNFSFHPEGLKPVLAETSCRFRRPIGMHDKVVVGVKITNMQPERGQLEEEYIVWSTDQSTVAATGRATVVVCDYDNGGKRATLPESWISFM